ncbi:hypothetical protein U1Q18_020771 [Sarracenia purpurea var. burkii]
MARWVNPTIKTRLWPILEKAIKDSVPVDLQDLLLRLAFDNICGLTLGKNPETLSLDLPENPFAIAFDSAAEAILQRLHYPSFLWKLKKVLGFGAEMRLKKSLDVLENYMTEALATLLLRYRLSLVPGHQVEQKMSLTLFMKNGLRVNLHPRAVATPEAATSA